jgi:hypothetical protein
MMAGMNWMRKALHRIEENILGEIFVQQWTENGSGRRKDLTKTIPKQVSLEHA